MRLPSKWQTNTVHCTSGNASHVPQHHRSWWIHFICMSSHKQSCRLKFNTNFISFQFDWLDIRHVQMTKPWFMMWFWRDSICERSTNATCFWSKLHQLLNNFDGWTGDGARLSETTEFIRVKFNDFCWSGWFVKSHLRRASIAGKCPMRKP